MSSEHQPARERFESLFRDHHDELTRFAIRRVDAETAADIVSGTFLTAWRRLTEGPAGHERAWLYSTARHLIGNEQRAQRRRVQLAERTDQERLVHEPDPSEAVTNRLRVHQVLVGLSEADREVLRLSQWEQLTDAEAAEVLGCTRTAFKVRLHRARQRFANRLAQLDEPATVHPIPLAPEEIRP